MSEEVTGQEVPEVPAAPQAGEEAPAQEAVETTAETEQPPEPKEDPLPRGVQKRIDRAVRRQHEAEERARALEYRLQALEQTAPRQQMPANVDQGAPTIDKFNNFDDYVRATAEWIADQRIKQTLTEREQQQQEAQSRAERARVASEWQKQIVKATVEMPDFEEVLGNSDVPMTQAMQHAIMESDVGAKLAYWLATNEDEASRIAQMTPTSQIRALGRIEEKLAKAPAAPVSKAPAPVKPVGGRASVEKNPDEMSPEEWVKWRNKQLSKA